MANVWAQNVNKSLKNIQDKNLDRNKKKNHTSLDFLNMHLNDLMKQSFRKLHFTTSNMKQIKLACEEAFHKRGYSV